MASGNIKAELTRSVNNLVDGFASLQEEFRNLASHHDQVKRELAAWKEKNQALRRLLPATQRDSASSTEHPTTIPPPSPLVTTRAIADWLEEFRGTGDSAAQKSIVRIRDAEFACFKLQERLKHKRPLPDLTLGPNSAKAVEGKVAFGDIEEDHTVARTPGELSCPFAKLGERKGPPPPYARTQGVSTPRSSTSQAGSLRSFRAKSHRTSFNDPIKPIIEETGSDLSDSGPACPIRFLDQHTPEDVAKYFEDHKHELPRSHEFCVKRFQSNAESIRQLDEKYGSLVTMIQGLGQKHQPMLPEASKSAGDGANRDESQSSRQRVKKWAKGVGDGQPEEAEASSARDNKVEDTVQSAGAADEASRASRFDRPLKEIRVGESPSRPWGVPIPSRYLDNDFRPEIVERIAPGQAVLWNRVPDGHSEAGPSRAPQPQASGHASRPTGKCPIDHAAMAAMGMGMPAQQAFYEPPQEIGTTALVATGPSEPEEAASERANESAREPNPNAARGIKTILNMGLAMVADSKNLDAVLFENRGTLVLGYNMEDTISLQRDYHELY